MQNQKEFLPLLSSLQVLVNKNTFIYLYLGENQDNPHLHALEGRGELGGTEPKSAALLCLRRTIRKIFHPKLVFLVPFGTQREHLSRILPSAQCHYTPISSFRARRETRRPLRWPGLQTAPTSALSSRRWTAALGSRSQRVPTVGNVSRLDPALSNDPVLSQQTLALLPQQAFHASLVWCCGAFGAKMFQPHRTFSFLGFSMPLFFKVSPAHRALGTTF